MGNDRTLNFCQTTDTSNLLTGPNFKRKFQVNFSFALRNRGELCALPLKIMGKETLTIART